MKNFIRWFKNLLAPVLYTKWKISKTIWPHDPGYGTVRKNRLTGKGVILDTGLTRMNAEGTIRLLNRHPTITTNQLEDIVNKRIAQFV